MPADIDSLFSVYALVKRVHPGNTLLRHRTTMSRVSYEIENATLVDGAHTRIFAGFQHMSKFVPQIARYTRIAAQSESVYVFGVPDVDVPPISNVTYVPLSEKDALAREWFLVSYGLDYASALATQELSAPNTPDSDRVFNGVWTFDLSLVSILQDWLTSTVDSLPLNWRGEDMRHGRQVELMEKSMSRLLQKALDVKPNVTQAQERVFFDELERVILAELQVSITERGG
jgi:DICT domain-containing protein